MMSWPDFSYKQIAVHIAGGSREKMRFRADNIIIQNEDDKVIFQHSCHRLFALFVIGEISLTSVALCKSAAFAFPIILLSRNMKVNTVINCAAQGNTLLRIKQYTAGDRNLDIAKKLVEQKIANQTALLCDLRYRSDADNESIDALKTIKVTAEDSNALLGIEGTASRLFFSAYFRPLDWKRREPRCKRDVWNLLLDIGYTYLFNFIEAMLSLYGFDVYCGVYHTFFYQRKSLVCDIVEPFRCIIDRRVRKAYNLKQIDANDFFIRDGVFNLKYSEQVKYTRLFMKDILAEKEAIFKFCQQYYRWFMRDKPISDFPVYNIK